MATNAEDMANEKQHRYLVGRARGDGRLAALLREYARTGSSGQAEGIARTVRDYAARDQPVDCPTWIPDTAVARAALALHPEYAPRPRAQRTSDGWTIRHYVDGREVEETPWWAKPDLTADEIRSWARVYRLRGIEIR